MTAAKRCAIYTRKSTTAGLEQEVNSLEVQRHACTDYAHVHGWQIVDKSYNDGGYTGATLERPAFQRLLIDAGLRQFDVVLVYKVDRLSRSLLDFARVLDRFDRLAMGFVSVTQNFSTNEAAGKLTLHLLMSFAEFERSMISERTRDKIVALRRSGRWSGGPLPFGYRSVNRELVPDEQHSGTVVHIFSSSNEQHSMLAVVGHLRQGGYPSRTRAWTKDAVRRILRNPVYAGRFRIGGRYVVANHHPIVPIDIFERTQVVLGRYASHDRSLEADPSYLLRGILRCGTCGASMRPHSTRGYRYYRCNTQEKQGKEACPARHLSAGAIEDFVIEQVRSLSQDLVSDLRAVAVDRECSPDSSAPGSIAMSTDEDEMRWVGALLQGFGETWSVLTSQNRRRVLLMLIDRILVGGSENKLVLLFADRLGGQRHERELHRSGRKFVAVRQIAGPSRAPRAAKMLALAHEIQRLLDAHIVQDRGAAARLMGCSRPRITQLLNLLLLAPDIQEQLLFARVESGIDKVHEHGLRSLSRIALWRDQRRIWEAMRPDPV